LPLKLRFLLELHRCHNNVHPSLIRRLDVDTTSYENSNSLDVRIFDSFKKLFSSFEIILKQHVLGVTLDSGQHLRTLAHFDI
jgi:hypothetical protein